MARKQEFSMGIVMAICMLAGIVLLSPWRPARMAGGRAAPAIAGLVLLAGMWNALWHGLRHLDTFWGLVALATGLLMMATGLLVLRAQRAAPGPLRIVLLLGLLAGFLLYSVTLVQLNLGHTIIGA
jgi:peptidoglycan/LPS O-acetylase OafA/YrhL